MYQNVTSFMLMCLKFQKYTIHWWSSLIPSEGTQVADHVLPSQSSIWDANSHPEGIVFCTFWVLPVELFSVPFHSFILTGGTVWVSQASCQ